MGSLNTYRQSVKRGGWIKYCYMNSYQNDQRKGGGVEHRHIVQWWLGGWRAWVPVLLVQSGSDDSINNNTVGTEVLRYDRSIFVWTTNKLFRRPRGVLSVSLIFRVRLYVERMSTPSSGLHSDNC